VVNLLVVWAGLHHVLAVPVGVLAGFVWNWTWDSQIIFRRQADGQQPS
jgi:putative flippase GtrA